MKKKRFFSLVALVLVFCMVFTIPASAATAYPITNYLVGTTNNGYDVTTYRVSDCYIGLMYTQSSLTTAPTYTDLNSRTVTYTVSQSWPLMGFLLGFIDHSSNSSASTNNYFSFNGVNDVDYFRQAALSSYFRISSSKAATIKYRLNLAYVDSSGSSVSTVYGNEVVVVLTAGQSYTFDLESVLTVPSSAVGFVPYIQIKLTSPPTGAELTIDYNNFEYVVTSGEEVPEFPSFSKNLGTEVTYLHNTESDALTVSASVSDGGTLSYQWYQNTIPSTSGGTAIPNEKSATFYPTTTVLGTSYYYCVATNTKNGKTSTTASKVATVRTISAPKAPQLSQNLLAGTIEYEKGATPSALSITAFTTDDGTISYQWYSNTTDSTDGGTPLSSTLSYYYPKTDTVGTTYYYCVATNTLYGYTATTTSNVTAIRVVPPPDPAVPPTITTNLSTEEVIYTQGDAAAALRIGATASDGGTLSYQWYQTVDGTTSAMAGETLATMTPETAEVGTTYYYCLVTNTLGKTTASTKSAVAMITVTKDNTETLLGSIIDGITGMWESLKGLWESIKELPQKFVDGLAGFFADLSEGLSNVGNFILELPQKILDGIKDLFVPDEEYMASYQELWDTLLADRFGAVYESVAVIDGFFSIFDDVSSRNTLTVPSVSVNFAGTEWIFGGWEVVLIPEGFDKFVILGKQAVSIICTLAFVNSLRNRFDRLLGGGNV